MERGGVRSNSWIRRSGVGDTERDVCVEVVQVKCMYNEPQ